MSADIAWYKSVLEIISYRPLNVPKICSDFLPIFAPVGFAKRFSSDWTIYLKDLWNEDGARALEGNPKQG